MRQFATILVLIVFYTPQCLAGATVVYVSIAGEKAIGSFILNEATGVLTEHGRLELPGEPGGLTLNPNRDRMFASLRSVGKLSSLDWDSSTGALRIRHIIDAAADPAYVATDRSGRWLLSAYYRAGSVAVHSINENGHLGEAKWYPTAEKAHAILTDQSNRIALVPHTAPNRIYGFRFDEHDGSLVRIRPAFLETGEQTGPRHIVFHPRLPLVYAVNEQGSSISVLGFNQKTGKLIERSTYSTLPDDSRERNACADLEFSPDHRFLYASNRGHDSIAGFRVMEKTGDLQPIGQFKTARTPRQFTVTPSGKFIVAAGQGDGRLIVFGRDLKTGRLNQVSQMTVGERPWWVMSVELD